MNLTRIVCVGQVPDELCRKTEAAAYVNARLHASTRPGIISGKLYETAAKAYAERGYADEINLHHQGGATGYRTRDWVANPHGTETVCLNQAFAWNPSITGTKVEETCILTERGIEHLTVSPDFPTVTIDVDGTPYASPGILSI